MTMIEDGMIAPLLLFLGDAPDIGWAKTASGLAQWRPEDCAGQYRLAGCQVDLGLPDMDFAAARAAGVRTLVIGIANDGGFIADSWVPHLIAALGAGLDIAAGLHERLADHTEIAAAASEAGRSLHDLRQPKRVFRPGTGKKRSGLRLLTVGTDCAVGKKYTALSLEREMRARGMAATFCPTGQTGIMITGRGIAIDSVVADFISGAAEWLSPPADRNHWHLIEGQGALLHPAYAGVTLGLVHGSQPDAMVICHEAGRTELQGYEGDFACPSLRAALDVHLAAARLTNPAVRGVGVSLNTSLLDEGAARDALKRAEDEMGLPACDPLRWGAGAIVDHLARTFPA
ncbi:DUF1611 domain-containing protein [Sphingopyxis lindanitolerans]|uniref:DUF1611 domain-containing protein n=1 Tax=Sphingopyxis lindanitolerans TaxID=2054227 RepID=A0A2S8B0V2_9SPHN|nr:DUF1611 domain-containing protein [Sphingopyxis lindanitolerans]PQM26035.1 DUF1611 domain-containing protein [Sphingopyxis lindanitolerans]